ncbi:MAG: hypothetical protein RSE36_04505 [Oscillospiraceae bacterium]
MADAKNITVNAIFRALTGKHEEKKKAASAVSVSNGIPAEVVAAISAAVSCMCKEGAVIRDIKRTPKQTASAGRSSWSTAGLLENTRAF